MNYNREVSYIKGIGIILIVLGHCCGFIQPYLNMFHVAIFFFVIGYTYNYEKYAVNYPLLIGTRIYSLLSQYIIYMIIIMLCHNLFIDIGMIDDIAVKYYGFDYINQFISFFFLNYEPECGAVWFLVPWLSSTLLFGYLCWKYNKYSKSTLLICGTCILLGILGELLITYEFSSGYRLETTFLVMPVVLFGWLIKKYDGISKINWWGGLLSIIIVVGAYKYYGASIIISSNVILSPYTFYIITLAGLYLVGYMVKILDKLNWTRWNIIEICGKYSFDIMVLHILFFRLCWAVSKVLGETREYASFVFSHSLVCFVTGIFCPIIIRYGYNYCMSKMKRV